MSPDDYGAVAVIDGSKLAVVVIIWVGLIPLHRAIEVDPLETIRCPSSHGSRGGLSGCQCSGRLVQ